MQRSIFTDTAGTSQPEALGSPAVHLRSGGTSVVLDTTTSGLPTIVWWGEDLGEVSDDVLQGLLLASRPQRVSGGIDEPARLTLLPQETNGWQGTAALVGNRAGQHVWTAFSATTITTSDTRPGEMLVSARDDDAHLGLDIHLLLDEHGLLHQSLTLTNTHPGNTGSAGGAGGADDFSFELVELAASFPVPASASEILDTTGRHLRERTPQRHPLTTGRYDRESRRGRPGADATLLLAVGASGFGFERGTVHAAHLAWSGNHRLSVERTTTGVTHLRAAELLSAGEVRLAPGQSYTTPSAVASWGDGLTELSGRFHDYLRARPHHPSTPRPVTLNTWEAVYFDHDLTRLSALADTAARVGVERFVLDDGWFRGRRDDTAGLGDWEVDPDVWPEGLSPLIDHVTDIGLQFGLWVEPEMVNPDSDLARQHPDWMLSAGPHVPASARQQQVLDLTNPAAWQHILERLDAVLTEYDIAYLKWDHNRDLLGAFSPATGRPAVHENVLALYRLLDELKSRHPGLEIESCASGGARVDLGIIEHTDRIWASDCIDPIERMTIQKYTNLLIPYELTGAHVGGPRSHSTGRRHDLNLRAGVAFPGHFGIEWDLTTLDEDDLDDVAAWVSAHKTHRNLLHSGRAVFADLTDQTADVRGVIAADGSAALFTYTQVTSSATYPAAPVTFPGLENQRRYRIRLGEPTSKVGGPGQSPLAWTLEPLVLTGRALRTKGLQAPVLFPEQLLLIEFTAVD